MKRAKIMLMGIAVVAVVGAGLAFKANRFTTSEFFGFTKVAGVETGCYVPTFLTLTTAGGVVITTYATKSFATTTSAACTALVTTSSAE